MRAIKAAFPGIGISCDSVIVDDSLRRLRRPVVSASGPSRWHCIALWSRTHHSYYVRVENEADHPLYYKGHGRTAIVDELFVEPPIKVVRDRRKPGSGRRSISFEISVHPQDPRVGRVVTAGLHSRIYVHAYLPHRTGDPVPLPHEPGNQGYASTHCNVE